MRRAAVAVLIAVSCSAGPAPKHEAAPSASVPVPLPLPVPVPSAPADDGAALPTSRPDVLAAPASFTLFVREARVDCEGEGPMRCLQVRSADSDPWTLLYTRIDGLDYEEGFAYELRVTPGGRGKPKYRLVEIISKKR